MSLHMTTSDASSFKPGMVFKTRLRRVDWWSRFLRWIKYDDRWEDAYFSVVAVSNNTIWHRRFDLRDTFAP